MAEIYIFNPSDELLTTISPETGLISAPFREEKNRLPEEPFSFTVDASFEETVHIKEENQVVFKDKEGDLRLYVIRELDDSDGVKGPETTAVCEPAFMELKERIVIDRRFTNQEAQVALNAALQGTGWKGSVEVELGTGSTNFYYENAIDCIWKIIDVWGGEFKDVVTFDKSSITLREIKILNRRGYDRGKRFEIDHNMEGIRRTVLSYPITAIYGRGASLEITDEEGNVTGGNTRFIDFADVEWKKSNGDPVDKPKGQRWVGDPDALKKYGRLRNGAILHREAEWQNGDYEDPKELLQATWDQLQLVKGPEVNYQLDAYLFESIAGYEHEHVALGDNARAVDRNFSRPIEIQSRVIAISYDLVDIERTAEVEMGQFLSVHDYDDRLDKVAQKVGNNSGAWDQAAKPIDNKRYPNIVPAVPSNVTATGLFAMVMVEWDFDFTQVYIQGYEVFASEVKGFLPSPETLVYRGLANSYSYEGEPNKQYYFRVRAFNYHQRFSLYSEEVSATTAKIISDDIFFGPEIAAEIHELSKQANLIAENTLSGKELVDGAIIDSKIAQGAIDMQHLKPGIIDLEKFTDETIEQIRDTAKEYTDEEIQEIRESIQEELKKKAGLEFVEGKFKFSDAKLIELDETAESLRRQVGDIDESVSKINLEVDEAKSQLEINAQELKNVDKTLTSHETQIGINAQAITARATKDELDTVKGTVSRLRGDFEFSADGLRTDFSNLSKSIDSQLVSINEKQSVFEQTVDGFKSTVSSIETVANQASRDVIQAEAKTNELTQTVGQFTSKVSAVEKEVKSVGKGGRNYAVNGDFSDGLNNWRNWGTASGSKRLTTINDLAGFKTGFYFDSTSTGENGYAQDNIETIEGEEYLLSAWVRVTKGGGKVRIQEGNSTNGWTRSDYDVEPIKGEWTRVTHAFTAKSTFTGIYIGQAGGQSEFFSADVTGLQLEKGISLSDWKPAPDDAIDRITRTETAIEQTKDEVALRATKTEVNNLNNTVTNMKADITANAREINLRVERNKLMAEINVQPESVKIKAGLIHLSGSSRIDNAVIQDAHINNLSGDKILANTIGASQLLVADFTNLVVNGDFEYDTTLSQPSGWQVPNPSGTTTSIQVLNWSGWGNNNGSKHCLGVPASNSQNIDILQDNFIPVTPGEEFHFQWEARFHDLTGNAQAGMGFRMFNGSKGHIRWRKAGWTTSRHYDVRTYTATLTIPNDTFFVKPWIVFDNNGSNSNRFFIDNIIVRKKYGGELIVDGSIEAKHIRANTITANSGIIATAAIGTAAIANGAITRAKLENAIIGTAQIENGAISNAKIGNAAIDNAKIANGTITNAKISDLSASKLTSGTINTASITIRGGSSTNYTVIEQDQLHTRGNYWRSWFEGDEYIESETTVGGGMVRISKLNDPRGRRNLYLTNNGLSTYVGGADGGEGFGSGVIEFWSHMFAQDRRGLSLYSNLGTIGLRTDSRDIILWANRDVHAEGSRSVSLLCNNGEIKIAPRRDNRAGVNEFLFNVKLNSSQNETDGWIQYGDPNNSRGSGIRFGKNLAEVHITNYNGDYESGTLWANDIRVKGRGRIVNNDAGITYVQADREVRISGYLTSELRPLIASNVSIGSSRKLKTNIIPFNGKALDVINELNVMTYNLIDEVERGITDNMQVGIISEDSPSVVNKDGVTIDTTKLTMYNVRATQELSEKLNQMQKSIYDEINQLKEEIRQLKAAG